MRGWLIVNSFVSSEKFRELYAFFENAARRQNIVLEVRTTDTLVCTVEVGYASADLPDFVLFWDKDIYLAQQLERAGVPVFNSAAAIRLCDNKILTALALAGKVATPRTVIAPKTFEGVGYNRFAFLERAIDILGLPVIIKEAYGSFGQQVYLAHDAEEAQKILGGIGYKECLLQEFIATSRGRDVRVNVVGGEVVASMLRYSETDFRSNITAGGKMAPFTPTEAQKEIALRACEVLGLDFAGVDVLFGKDDTPYICEVNSNPHFKTTLACTGVDMSERILAHIVSRLR